MIPTNNRQANKTEKRKNEILLIASELFAEYGYQGTTLEAIAERLDITRAALYRYFSSKDEIFFKCNEIAYDKFLKTLNELNVFKDPETRLLQMLKSHILLYLNDFPTFGPILLSIRVLPREYREEIILYRRKIEKEYILTIKEWKEMNSNLKQIEDSLILNVLLGTVNSILWWNKTESMSDSEMKKMASQVASILIDGLFK